jgi:hypothetical protein
MGIPGYLLAERVSLYISRAGLRRACKGPGFNFFAAPISFMGEPNMVQENACPAANHQNYIAPGVPNSATPDPLEPSGETTATNGQNHRPPTVQELASIITSAPDLSQASRPFLSAVQKLVDCQIASIYAI